MARIYTLRYRFPAGWFVLSLYDFNKDGQIGSNRWRDYRISIRARPGNIALESIGGFESWPEMASGRIVDFRGGVWKRFLVRGPRALTIEVNRNHSFNTVLAGVFLDQWQERPAPYFGTADQSKSGAESRAAAQREEFNGERAQQKFYAERATPQQAALRAQRFAPGRDADETALRLYEALREARALNPVWHETQSRPFYLALLGWFRQQLPDAFTPPGSLVPSAKSSEAERALRDQLATCFYELRMYEDWERQLRAKRRAPGARHRKRPALGWQIQLCGTWASSRCRVFAATGIQDNNFSCCGSSTRAVNGSNSLLP